MNYTSKLLQDVLLENQESQFIYAGDFNNVVNMACIHAILFQIRNEKYVGKTTYSSITYKSNDLYNPSNIINNDATFIAILRTIHTEDFKILIPKYKVFLKKHDHIKKIIFISDGVPNDTFSISPDNKMCIMSLNRWMKNIIEVRDMLKLNGIAEYLFDIINKKNLFDHDFAFKFDFEYHLMRLNLLVIDPDLPPISSFHKVVFNYLKLFKKFLIGDIPGNFENSKTLEYPAIHGLARFYEQFNVSLDQDLKIPNIYHIRVLDHDGVIFPSGFMAMVERTLLRIIFKKLKKEFTNVFFIFENKNFLTIRTNNDVEWFPEFARYYKGGGSYLNIGIPSSKNVIPDFLNTIAKWDMFHIIKNGECGSNDPHYSTFDIN